ncbi:hypothetical protein CBER1_06135 [Cercospora berteroae]|uniref:Protein kinase domain-containing protein n=1 Tax=Cercospora berteroae TaxID=357750 RepID=A0A2S6C3J6_9PEZI|nr:hypothetical protein CBER1_06135 [Cercospora berteroae]
MPLTSTDLIHPTRIDAVLWEDSKYAYTRHTYYGWRKDPIGEYVWRRDFKAIGTGGFGAVFREECIQGQNNLQKAAVRAVKHIQRPAASQHGIRIDYGRELEAIARFSKPEYEPFFVQSEGWYEAEDIVCIIMEFIQHGSLHDYVRQSQALPEPEAQLIVSQILRGIAHMHRAGYTHRDLKPQNLLVVQQGPAWRVKIADFGLSKRLIRDLSSLRTVAGTAGYMAPEVLGILAPGDDSSEDSDESESPHERSYTNAVDIWAVGVILSLLLSGQFPFPSHNQKLLAKYVHGRAPFPVASLESNAAGNAARDLAAKLLTPRPGDRPSAESCLRHNWVEFPQNLSPIGAGARQAVDVFPATSRSVSWNTRDSGYQTGRMPQLASSVSDSGTVRRVISPISPPMDAGFPTLRERSFGKAPGEVLAMNFSPVSRVLLIAYKVSSSVSSFYLWNTQTGEKEELAGQTDIGLAHVPSSFSQDGKLLVVLLSLERRLTLHDGVTGKLIRGVVAVGQEGSAYRNIWQWSPKGVAFMAARTSSSKASELPSVGPSRLIYFGSCPTRTSSIVGVTVDEITGRSNGPSATFECDRLLLAAQNRVVVGERNESSTSLSHGKLGFVSHWSEQSGTSGSSLVEIHGLVGQVAVSPTDRGLIAFFDRREGVLSLRLKHSLRDSKSQQDMMCAVLPDRASPAGLAFSPNGKYIAFTQFQSRGQLKADTRCLRMLSVGTQEEVMNIDIYPGSRDVAFSPDGCLLAIGNLTGRVTLYDVTV